MGYCADALVVWVVRSLFWQSFELPGFAGNEGSEERARNLKSFQRKRWRVRRGNFAQRSAEGRAGARQRVERQARLGTGGSRQEPAAI